MDVIYGLLGMLLGDAGEDTSATLLSLSSSVENCSAMRQAGCLPLLVQLIHTPDQNPSVRRGASRALYNIVRATQDQDQDNQELHVLELIQQLREYSQSLRLNYDNADDTIRHPIPAMSILFKLSFSDKHRNTMCLLGGLHAIAEIIEVDHNVHGSLSDDQNCLALRRYAGMILTVLTLNDSKNNSFLCSCSGFIKSWVAQLKCTNEDLHQVTASVFRNLSWRADSNSKRVLREMGTVTSLTVLAMQTRRESTLKSALSALWNLSAHCASNKVDICAVAGALEFLIDMLTFKAPSKRIAIVENASGILRNVSSHVAIEEKYREILRNKNGLHILVKLLRSPSLIIVSNACGTLWNLSARCTKDQKTLWVLGAVPILKNLMQSKHKMISTGACHALRNLLAAKGGGTFQLTLPVTIRAVNPSQPQDKNGRPGKVQESSISIANCHSTSVENSPDSRSEEQSLSDKSWSFSRPPSSPLGDEETNELIQSNTIDNSGNQNGNEKDNYSKSSYDDRRKGSPIGSSYYDENCPAGSVYEADGDQPVDYSKKYVESHPSKQQANMKIKSSRREKEFTENEENLFGDYAETDLDQPTDYSLRYAEDDTDDDEKDERYFNGNEQEDTVKTYCTEGTPYETPFNFSTATSMSDLRLEDPKDESSKKLFKNVNGPIQEFNECNQKEITEEIDLNKSDDGILENGNVQTAEVPYYDDDRASGGISRVNSLSSLNSAMVTKSEAVTNDNSEESDNLIQKSEKRDINEETSKLNKVTELPENKIDKEAKVVTFGGENYAEETPLMFSRCSSLGSLSGFEQHSIHDDRSSIISDFSRRTSGAVSPSELPDSPTQTVPPSPRNQKTEFNSRGGGGGGDERQMRPQFAKCTYEKTKNSVFEDDTAAFKEESTPIEFSAATSLSSLTIDDEPKLQELPETFKPEVINEPSPASAPPVDEIGLKENFEALQLNEKDQEQVSDCDGDDDEDILAACINMGMQNNRYRENFKKSEAKSYPLSVTNLIRYQTSSTLDRLDTSLFEVRTSISPVKTKLTLDLPITPDTMHVYCTEDTPADISPVGSQSNLSALSMPSIIEDFEKGGDLGESRNDLSDDSSNLSGDDEKILDECIQSGMSKPISPSAVLSTKVNDNYGKLRENRGVDTRTIVGQDQESNNSSDESPSQSDDDAILAECIESAMPKARLMVSGKPSTSRQSEKIKKDFDNSRTQETIKSPLSEDSLSLSEEEEEMILAQCIRSGMPKASTSVKNFSPIITEDSRRLYTVSISSPTNFSPRHLSRRKDLAPQGARDEMSDFVTEDTPCNFSVVSDISNLSINSTLD